MPDAHAGGRARGHDRSPQHSRSPRASRLPATRSVKGDEIQSDGRSVSVALGAETWDVPVPCDPPGRAARGLSYRLCLCRGWAHCGPEASLWAESYRQGRSREDMNWATGTKDHRTRGPTRHARRPCSSGAEVDADSDSLNPAPKMCLHASHLSGWLLSKLNQTGPQCWPGRGGTRVPCALVGTQTGLAMQKRTEGPPKIKQNVRVTQTPHHWVSVSRGPGSWVWRGRRPAPDSVIPAARGVSLPPRCARHVTRPRAGPGVADTVSGVTV